MTERSWLPASFATSCADVFLTFWPIYLAASWGIVEFVNLLVDRYELSLHLLDLSIVALLSLLPRVLLLVSYTVGRENGAGRGSRRSELQRYADPARQASREIYRRAMLVTASRIASTAPF